MNRNLINSSKSLDCDRKIKRKTLKISSIALALFVILVFWFRYPPKRLSSKAISPSFV